MLTRLATGAAVFAVALAWGVPMAKAQVTTSFTAGNFTYQFTTPVTQAGGGVPITTLTIPGVGQSAKVSVFLLQTGGTPADVFNQSTSTPAGLGVEGLGVRLNYSGTVADVPNTFASSITARPAPTFDGNPNGLSSDFGVIGRYGTGTTTNTATSAALSEGLNDPSGPLPFPGDDSEDPQNNPLRMLIGTFTFTGLAGGSMTVTAVSGPTSGGVNNLTGPNPPIVGARDDGTTGDLPGNGSQGEVHLDQYLNPVAPTLTVTVVPEPGTLALGGLATLGLAGWRRRRTAALVAA